MKKIDKERIEDFRRFLEINYKPKAVEIFENLLANKLLLPDMSEDQWEWSVDYSAKANNIEI